MWEPVTCARICLSKTPGYNHRNSEPSPTPILLRMRHADSRDSRRDIEQVIQLFRANYGDDYAIPEFYDPHWSNAASTPDHIIWLVIEQDSRIVASARPFSTLATINDQIAEIGRLVVDPQAGGKGLAVSLLNALVDASDDRVEFAFGEARTTHPKTQRIFDHVGLVPLGFLPMAYMDELGASPGFSAASLFGNGRNLRQIGAAQVLPEIIQLARLSLRNLELDEPVTPRPDARAYPLDEQLHIEPLSGRVAPAPLKDRARPAHRAGSVRRPAHRPGVSQLRAHRATYLVASEDGNTLGAVGFMHDEAIRNVRIIELIARDDHVKGSLLRRAVEEAEQMLSAEAIDCDVSAYSPRLQRTLMDLGSCQPALSPAWSFTRRSRWMSSK